MNETERQQAYDQAWSAFKTQHSSEYAVNWDRCVTAQRRVADECEAGRPWSDLADTYRWEYDQAMSAIVQLDKEACEAGEVALGALEAIEQMDAWVERRNQRNREAGAHLASIGKADIA